MAIERKVMQDKIDRFLEEEAKKQLANNQIYIEAYKKLQLLCTVYRYGDVMGEPKFASNEKFEAYVLGWGAEWVPAVNIRSEYYWDSVSVLSGEFLMLGYARSALWAEERVQKWEEKKAKLENKIAKTDNVRKIQKLKEKIRQGDEQLASDIIVVNARREAEALVEQDEHYFARAARDIKLAEKEAVKNVIQANTEKEEISELVFNVLDKYNEKDESRFYRYGKQIVEEQQSKMAQQDKLDEIKKNLAQETNQENNVEDEIEAE